VERVQSGSALVDQAGRTMTEIIGAVQRVTDIMGEIAAASEEQSSGIEQVARAVNQMDEVTQQNAALVEEAAAAAQSLEDQAGKLRTAVAVFQLEEGAFKAPAAQIVNRPATRSAKPAVRKVAAAPRARASSAAPPAAPAAASAVTAATVPAPAKGPAPAKAPAPAAAGSDNDWETF